MSIISDLIIANITRRLKSLDKRPQWLSDQTGISPGMLSNLLKGKEGKDPRISTLLKIADKLGCTVSDLCGDQPIVSKEELDAAKNKIGELTMELERIKNHPILVAYEKAVPDLQYAVRDLLSLEKNVSSVETDLRKSESPKKRRDSQ